MSTQDVSIRPRVLLGIPAIESGQEFGGKLDAAGCRSDHACNVAECVSLLEQSKFELIVLDVSLNGSDGEDVVSLCRRSAPLFRQAPLVFTSVSGRIPAEKLAAVRELGTGEFIEMPLSSAFIDRLVTMARGGIEQSHFGDASTEDELADSDFAPAASEPAARVASYYGSGHENDAETAARLAELSQSLVGSSPSMAAIRQLILEVAPTRASVMIYGESGTGKELVAQAIHRYSKQSKGPFVPVNMAAIPHGLAESLLFGHERGAFTSAVHNQAGWCEAANDGTLFLDEVGDMELQVQPKLLRFLQEGALQRVGSQASQRVSVRVITATNQEPGAIVTDGRMREDLFFRLHVVPIYVPPLRERPEDIPELAMLFLRRSAVRHDRIVERFSNDALRVLQQHDWPGNVRQLENTVERLVIFARGRIVEADHIPADDHLVSAYAERRRVLAGMGAGQANGSNFDPIVSLTPIERHERGAIVDALRRVDGHVIDAARLLGLGQATVYRKIKQYAIPHERKRRRKKPK